MAEVIQNAPVTPGAPVAPVETPVASVVDRHHNPLMFNKDSKISGNSDVPPKPSGGNPEVERRIHELTDKNRTSEEALANEKKAREELQANFDKMKENANGYYDFYTKNQQKVQTYDQIIGADAEKAKQHMAIIQGQAPEKVNYDDMDPETALKKQMEVQAGQFNQQITGLQNQLAQNTEQQNATRFEVDLGNVIRGKNFTNENDIVRATKFISNELRAGNGQFNNPQDLNRLADLYVAERDQLQAEFKESWTKDATLNQNANNNVPPVHGNSNFQSQNQTQTYNEDEFKSDGKGIDGDWNIRMRKAMILAGLKPG